MRTTFVNQGKKINMIEILVFAIGCANLPLWTLGVYQSFKEGPIEIQGFIMSSAALAVSICWITTTLFRRKAAIAALIFSCLFLVANFIYNTNSLNQLITGLVFGLLFLGLSTIYLFCSHTQGASAMTNTVGRPTWTSWGILSGLLFVFLFLVMLIGIYGLGYTF